VGRSPDKEGGEGVLVGWFACPGQRAEIGSWAAGEEKQTGCWVWGFGEQAFGPKVEKVMFPFLFCFFFLYFKAYLNKQILKAVLKSV
jgi:hypothetical protein